MASPEDAHTEARSAAEDEGQKLLAAAAAGDLETLSALLDNGADVLYQVRNVLSKLQVVAQLGGCLTCAWRHV